MRKFKRNIKVIQTLYDIAVKTAGIRHKLHHSLNRRALKCHAASHNKAYISAAENNDLAAGHIALHVDKLLSRAGGKNPRAAAARNIDCSPGTLSAAASQNNRTGVDVHKSVGFVYRRYALIRAETYYGRGKLIFDAARLNLANKSCRIFRPGKLFLKGMQTETVVNTLIEYSAEIRFALENKYNRALPRQTPPKPQQAPQDLRR